MKKYEICRAKHWFEFFDGETDFFVCIHEIVL